MKPTQVFPTVLIVLNLVSGGVYAYYGNIRQFLYWLAAALITASVTY